MTKQPDKKDVYAYTRNTGEYYGVESATLCPVTKTDWHIPACATEVMPPPERVGYARVFSEQLKKWSYVEDHRGKEAYNKITAETSGVVDALGVLDDRYTFEKPPAYPVWNGAAWAEDADKKKAAEEKNKTQDQMLQEIIDLRELVDDILERGVDVVKAERQEKMDKGEIK